MKTVHLAVAAAAVLLAAACSSMSQSGVAAASASAAPTIYQCESGARARASYPDVDSAVLEYQGKRHHLGIAVSASGSRYVGDGIEWWTKGADASIFVHQADGSSGDLIDSCTAQ